MKNYLFNKLTIAVDMAGCPNRCKHCFMSHSPNRQLDVEIFKYIADDFKKYCKEFVIYSWSREPEFHEDYQLLYELEKKLSTINSGHYELISFYRLVRDENYILWLKKIGLEVAQLTLFGLKENTDLYVGRKNAYEEIIEAINILLDNKIIPRIQIFVYQDNIADLEGLIKVFEELRLEERIKELGSSFDVFLHQGSPSGEAYTLVDKWITSDDIKKIPEYLIEKSLKHFNTNNIDDVFGYEEQALYAKYLVEEPCISLKSENPVFYIDCFLNVYPNTGEITQHYSLGSLRFNSCQGIINNYIHDVTLAMHLAKEIPFKDMLIDCGAPISTKLFGENDYIFHILFNYLRKNYEI